MAYRAKTQLAGCNVEFVVDTGNAAFYDSDGKYKPAYEILMIKRRLAREVLRGEQSGVVMDTNGNSVGSWKLAV